MGRSWLWVLAAFVFTASVVLGACCADRRRPIVYHASPLTRLRLHGDVNFTPLERGLIDQATRDLVIQTGGWFDVQIVWDFDMSGTAEELLSGHTIVRKESLDMLVLLVEARRGSGVLGFTLVEKHQTVLVADKLETPARWRHVAMHELLHSIGLEDLRHHRQRGSVMFWATTGAEPSTCMTQDDAVEFCRVLDCDASRMNYCDARR